MNSDNLIQLVQTGFRVTLGATTSLVESLQDAQKREHNLALLSSDVNQLLKELAEKGEITEQEARKLVESFLAQQRNSGNTNSSGTSSYETTVSTPVAPPDVQLDLQELTAQIAALRTELEKLRAQDNRP